MGSNENTEYANDIERCRNCDGEVLKRLTPEGCARAEDRRCLLCDRYYRQGRLFLNNVG